MHRTIKNPRVTGWRPSAGIQKQVSKVYQKNSSVATPSVPSSETIVHALGLDTVQAFIPGLRLIRNSIKSESGVWQALQQYAGARVVAHCSHGAHGKRWSTASRSELKRVLATVARQLAKQVTGGCSYKWLLNQILEHSATRIDVAWDVCAEMQEITVTAPESQYGKMREIQFATGPTRYWGDRGGYYTNRSTGERIYTRASAREMRVYDKRQEMKDVHGVEIGRECTRIEQQLNGSRAIETALGVRTLGELLALPAHELNLRLGVLMANLNVSVRGETLSPLSPYQRREIEKRDGLSKRLRRAEKQAKRATGHKGVTGDGNPTGENAGKSQTGTEKEKDCATHCFRARSRRVLSPEWERERPTFPTYAVPPDPLARFKLAYPNRNRRKFDPIDAEKSIE